MSPSRNHRNENLLGEAWTTCSANFDCGHLRLAARGTRRRIRATALRAAGGVHRALGLGGRPGRAREAGRVPRPPPRCACGAARCAAPGLHPAPGAGLPGASRPGRTREAGAESGAAGASFPTGRAFDVLDVPEQAGLQALVRLERMGTQVGPVMAPPTGRLQFFVAPGTAGRAARTALPDGLGRRRPRPAPATARALTSPPRRPCWTVSARSAGCAARPGTTPRCPPEARLLLGTLAYACHRGRIRRAEPAWPAA